MDIEKAKKAMYAQRKFINFFHPERVKASDLQLAVTASDSSGSMLAAFLIFGSSLSARNWSTNSALLLTALLPYLALLTFLVAAIVKSRKIRDYLLVNKIHNLEDIQIPEPTDLANGETEPAGTRE